jgi:hypothetical protein
MSKISLQKRFPSWWPFLVSPAEWSWTPYLWTWIVFLLLPRKFFLSERDNRSENTSFLFSSMTSAFWIFFWAILYSGSGGLYQLAAYKLDYAIILNLFDLYIYSIKSAIGFGIGLGANVLVRFALKYSSKIYGLILINCITRGVRWLEGFSLKVFIFQKITISFYI